MSLRLAAGRGGGHHRWVISVLAVEDEPAHQQAYEAAVRGAPDLHWAGSFGTAAAGIAALETHNPDVLLVDLGLPDASGLEVIRAARRLCPQAESMVVSVFGDERSLAEAIRSGATGYLLKDTRGPALVAAIRELRAGHSPISPPLARHLLRAYPQTHHEPAAAATGGSDADAPVETPLSRRETEILRAVAQGLTFSEIGERNFISPHTVATHVKNIYRKLEAHSKVQAVQIARGRGLLA